jgi:gliding motility-associated protein GldM
MASGKETPRQKMIGMMYLVLTALLALNVSKDILQAFVVVNGSLERTNDNFREKTDGQYSAFDKAKQIDEKKVKANWDKAQAVKLLSKELLVYIEGIKKQVMGRTDGLSETQADSIHLAYINSKDNYDISTNIMIGESEDGSKGMSRELKNKLVDFKQKLYGFIDERDRQSIHLGINTDAPEHNEANENWELYNFYHTPLAAVVTILSKFQNDVKKAESDVVEYLFRQVNIDDFVFDTISAKVISPSNYVLLGEEYNADVFVAAYSKTKNPKVMVGDYDMSEKKFLGSSDSIYVEKGTGKYKTKPTHEGIYKYGGEVTLISPQGNKRIYPFESEYIVARPALTVSADKMNVFYMGVVNPVSISVPGVANENIIATMDNGSLVKKGNGKYEVIVKSGSKTRINVMAKMPNGENRSMGFIEYRVKQLPEPIPNINGKSGTSLKLSLSLLKAAQGIGVAYDGSFEFEAKASVKSFTFSYTKNGTAEYKSNGPYFTDDMKKLINTMKTGNSFYLEDVVTMGPDGVKHTANMKVTIIN